MINHTVVEDIVSALRVVVVHNVALEKPNLVPAGRKVSQTGYVKIPIVPQIFTVSGHVLRLWFVEPMPLIQTAELITQLKEPAQIIPVVKMEAVKAHLTPILVLPKTLLQNITFLETIV
jgi:hypothetical protein